MNKKIICLSILTGFVYAVTTCFIQVPIAELLFYLLQMESDSSLSSETVILLLISLFLVGIFMAVFYYRNAHLFIADAKWKQGLKFALFIYFANYIPQVFFLDADQGFYTMLHGGFPIIQVELFDFIILILTVFIMIQYMPYQIKEQVNIKKDQQRLFKCILYGMIFALVLVLIQEFLFPCFGTINMATAMNVLSENIPFFYGIMLTGFLLAGFLVSYYALFIKNKQDRIRFYCEFAIYIWCAFDLTMIPLGYGVWATVIFIIASLTSFLLSSYVILRMSKFENV